MSPASPLSDAAPVLEICIESVQGALAAVEGGADRIELCSALAADGLSPDAEVAHAVRRQCLLPLSWMVRPRPGDFHYSPDETEAMVAEIQRARDGGADGVVLGVLTSQGAVDQTATQRLVEAAYPLPVTFHRAFDQVSEAREALEDLIACGVTRVLTSGQQRNAIQGADLLAELVAASRGRLTIMPGGGVRAHNLAALRAVTAATEFHSSAARRSSEANPAWQTDLEEVRALAKILHR